MYIYIEEKVRLFKFLDHYNQGGRKKGEAGTHPTTKRRTSSRDANSLRVVWRCHYCHFLFSNQRKFELLCGSLMSTCKCVDITCAFSAADAYSFFFLSFSPHRNLFRFYWQKKMGFYFLFITKPLGVVLRHWTQAETQVWTSQVTKVFSSVDNVWRRLVRPIKRKRRQKKKKTIFFYFIL